MTPHTQRPPAEPPFKAGDRVRVSKQFGGFAGTITSADGAWFMVAIDADGREYLYYATHLERLPALGPADAEGLRERIVEAVYSAVDGTYSEHCEAIADAILALLPPELAALKAENERLRGDLHRAERALKRAGYTDDVGAAEWRPPVNVRNGELLNRAWNAEAALAASEARATKLAEALEPFAKLADNFVGGTDDTVLVPDDFLGLHLTLRDLRRARDTHLRRSASTLAAIRENSKEVGQ